MTTHLHVHPTLLCLIFATPCWMWMPSQAHAAQPGNASEVPATATIAKVASVFRDCAGCPEMKIIPAGRFDMGSPAAEKDREKNEYPAHRVKVAAFALGKTEITRGQFAAFVKNTKHQVVDNCWTLEDGKFKQRNGRNWRDLGFLQNDKHPVACISWNDARAYTKWLSRRTGKRYRLPSEAEWEYAARAKTVTASYWGNNPNEACKYANVADKTAQTSMGAMSWSAHDCIDGYTYTSPVGKFKANKFGLHDMLGNLWEWTEDSYHDNYIGAPTNGSAWQGKDTKRIIRGGSWNNGPTRVNAAKRGRDKPTSRYCNIGFRVARSLP